MKVENVVNLNMLVVAVVYLTVGYLVTRGHRSPVARFMSALGWPIELAQKLSGDKHLPYLFLLPNLVIFGLYTFAPLFMNVGFSLSDGQFFNFATREFSGLDNYYRIFSDIQIDTGVDNVENDKFFAALGFTFTFVIFQVPFMVLIAMFTAVVLNQDIVARGFWRAVFFYPVMLSPVVVGFLWQLILKRQGVLSQVLMDWGMIAEPIQWLTDPSWTMFWSIFVYTWAHLGFYMLILLAGLQSIPGDLYEAAEMDGTPAPRVFRRITLPLLMPILLVVTVLSLIKAFQAFEEFLAMEAGWISIVRYIFETSGLQGFRYEFGLGIAAAASLTVALILIVLSMFQFYLTRRETKL